MAYDPIFIDGFDNYKNSFERWTLGATTQGFDLSNTFSRHSWGKGAFIQGRLKAEMPQALTTILIEGAFKLTNRFQFPGHPSIQVGSLAVVDYPHVSVNLSLSQHPYFVYNFDNSIIAGPATSPDKIVQLNQWYWFMLKVVLHASAGSMEFAVNHPNNTWLSVSGVRTLNENALAPQYADYVQFSQQFGETFHIDDVVIQNGVTSQGFFGDVIAIGKRPISAGANAAWTPNPAVANYLNVDEDVTDEDTTRNESSTIGARDSHIIENITEVPDTSPVLAVGLAYRGKKSDVGSRSVQSVMIDGASTRLGTERFPSESAYLTWMDAPDVTKPTGGAWGTVAQFNALDLEIGYEVRS